MLFSQLPPTKEKKRKDRIDRWKKRIFMFIFIVVFIILFARVPCGENRTTGIIDLFSRLFEEIFKNIS